MNARHIESHVLLDYSLGELDPHQREAVLIHLARCGGCRTRLEEFQSLEALLSVPPPPANLLNRVLTGSWVGHQTSDHSPALGRWNAGRSKGFIERDTSERVGEASIIPVRHFLRHTGLGFAAAMMLGGLAGFMFTRLRSSPVTPVPPPHTTAASSEQGKELDTRPIYLTIKEAGWSAPSQRLITNFLNEHKNAVGIALTDSTGIVLHAAPGESELKGKRLISGLPDRYGFNMGLLTGVWKRSREITGNVVWSLTDPDSHEDIKLVIFQSPVSLDKIARPGVRNWPPVRGSQLVISSALSPPEGMNQVQGLDKYPKWDRRGECRIGPMGGVPQGAPIDQVRWQCDLKYWKLQNALGDVLSTCTQLSDLQRNRQAPVFVFAPALTRVYIPRLNVKNLPLDKFLETLALNSRAEIVVKGKDYFVVPIRGVKVSKVGNSYYFTPI